VGGSGLDIVLYPQFTANACGILEGRIDLSQWLSPSNGLTPRVFPDYDVQVELNLDADASGVATFVYEAGSTAFSNFVALGGAALPSAEPSVVSNRVTWDLGDLATNGVGSIHYRFRATCSKEANESHVARVRFNDRCGDGLTNRQFSATSATNILPTLLTANLVLSLKPETTYISSTNVVVTMEFLNSGAGPAYNVRPELVLPTNVAYRTSSVPAFSVSGTSVVWTLAYATPVGGLLDLDADGFFDDLPAGGSFQLFVTNSLLSCGDPTLRLRGSHGCGGSACQTPAEDASVFIPLAGSLVVRTTFPDDGIVCKTNTVSISVRNSGLTVDRLVQITEAIPAGISYVAGSSRYSFNGGTTNNIADPGITSPLTYSSALIPELLALDPGDEVTLLLDVYVDCNGVAGGGQFLATGRYTDLCGDTITNEVVLSVLPTRSPVLSLVKEARNLDGVQSNFVSGVIVADVGDRVVYRITVGHIPASQTPVQYMQLVDRLPTQYTFTAASPAPSSVSSNILTWNNATLMALAGGSPYTNTASAFTIFVTGTVISCTSVGDNIAQINYGCSTDCMVFAAGDSHVFSSESELSAGATSSLDLGACGGTKTLQVVNNGSTARGLVVTNVAPPGYVFTTASVTGEFNSAGLTLQLSGSPSGSVAVVNFSSAAASGAVDLNDDAADGLAALDLGYLESFTMTLNLVSDGSTLDGVANPNDLDYADPEPAGPANKSSLATVVLSNLCGSAAAISSTVSDIPDLPDPDIDLQPNSVIVTNGQVVTFTATVRNIAEQGDADNLHIRLRFGTGWTNLTLVSSNIVSSGTSALTYEQQGNTNVLITLPGVILDPVDDQVVLTFTARAVQGPGSFFARAEVVGVCADTNIVPGCTFTNTLGEAPLANTMTGSVISALNGRYYGFDQDQSFGAGYALEKTVRYRTEPAPGSASRTARIGEDLTYRIRAEYFGATFSNAVVNESLPTNLVFGVPEDAGSSANVTNWIWNPGTGVFTLPSPIIGSALFVVDIPVIARNSFTNQGEAGNQTIITNLVDSVFSVSGVTNDPPSSGTFVPVLEPNLSVVKSVSVGTNFVQAGDVIVFSNVVRHTGLSLTNAYDVFFTDTLPAGLTFSGLDFLADGFDNDGDGVTDEADEATLVSGNTITVTTNHNANLFLLATNQAFTVVFPALVTNQIVGTVVTNVSQVTWTSLPGVGTNLNERTGADGTNGLNNYVTSAVRPVFFRSVSSVTKTLVSTTQTNTADPQVTIGERLVYRVRVDMPQGIVTNAVVTDIVPLGLDFVGTNANVGPDLSWAGIRHRAAAGRPDFQHECGGGDGYRSHPRVVGGQQRLRQQHVFTIGHHHQHPDGILTNDYFELLPRVRRAEHGHQ
jgi:fimbrial isopeptide formation D2 family protein